MLKLIFEFRKGIFFIRLIGNLNKDSYQTIESEVKGLIEDNHFKYIVFNINYLETIDLTGLSYITKIYYLTKENKSNLILCDKTNKLKVLLNNSVPNICDELEVL